MRIVFGVDNGGHWQPAADLLARLRFREGVIDTLHCVEPPGYYLGAPVERLPGMQAVRENAWSHGQQTVDAAAAALRQAGLITGAADVFHGPAAHGLMRHADEVGAKLLVVGNSGHSPFGAFVAGSVGRGLTISAHQSVLIARSGAAPDRPLRAVFATDHSAYADRCVQTLRDLAPGGLSHLTVLSVYPKDALEALRPFLPDFVLDPSEWIEKGVEKRNQESIAALKPLGCSCDSRVASGEVHQAIRHAMAETQSDLLILGAQGHGFVERLSLGSVSFREALTEPHSVLVLRARREQSADTTEGNG